MLFLNRKDRPDLERYEYILNRRGYITLDYSKVKKIGVLLEAQYTTARRVVALNMSQRSVRNYGTGDKTELLHYLQETESVPNKLLSYTKKGNTVSNSLDSKRVLPKLIQSGYGKEVLPVYTMAESYKNRFGRCETLSQILQSSEKVDGYDSQLAKLYFRANKRQNLRFNYSNEDIIAMPKELNSCIKAPKGKFIVSGDFPQADLRITYNTILSEPDTVDFVSSKEDMYEALMALGEEKVNGIPRDKFRFQDKADRDKRKPGILAASYGAEGNSDKTVAETIHVVNSYFKSITKFNKFKKYIKEYCDNEIGFAIESYFGHREYMTYRSFEVNDGIDKALNTGSQTGTSTLVIFQVLEIIKKFEELGYTEEDVDILFVRHDEPIFIISENAMKDSWVFEDLSTIQVDNWTPMKVSFTFHKSYGVRDKDLDDKFKLSCKVNASKFTTTNHKHIISEYFLPIKPIFILEYTEVEIDEGILCILYHKDSNSFKSFIVSDVNFDRVMFFYEKGKELELNSNFTREFANILFLHENSLIEKLGNLNEYSFIEGGIGVFSKYSSVYGVSVVKEYLIDRYNAKRGTSYPFNKDILESNSYMTRTLRNLSVFE